MGTHKQVSLPIEEIRVAAGHPLAAAPWILMGIGLVALIGGFGLGFADPKQFLFSYLAAFLFSVSLALGALIFVLIQFVTRAGWSVAVRRVAENLAGTLPLFVLLFVPIALGLRELYLWADPHHVHGDALLESKAAYLNETFFLIRSAAYLLVWCGIAYWFRRQSVTQDATGDPTITRRLQNAGAPAILLFGVTLTFAAFDWIMSLDPHWYSTVFGVYFFAGAFSSSIALLILILLVFQRFGLLTNIVSSEHFHDLGKLLFGFVVFWAYIAFSQFMLIWYANIPEETIWYAHRWHHGWEYVSVLLAAGHFGIPFFVLISRTAKRNRTILASAAVWILIMHFVDLYWLVMPVHQSEGLSPHFLDLVLPAGVLLLFVGFFLRLAFGPALVPTRDPRIAESLSFENL